METATQQGGLSLRDLVHSLERPPACKVCAAPTRLFDSVDFNKHCGAPPSMFGESGIFVEYFRCDRCGLLFTNLIDDWSAAEMTEFIYNADYIKVDPEYIGARAQRTAEHLAPLLKSCRELRILDYGSGSGVFAEAMGTHGFKKVESYDPLSSPQRPSGTFDLITCFESLEHAPQPRDTFAEFAGQLSRKGTVLIGQSLQPDDIEEIRGQWWYLAPRNGHVSFFTHDTFLELAERTRLKYLGGSGIYVFTRGWLTDAMQQGVEQILRGTVPDDVRRLAQARSKARARGIRVPWKRTIQWLLRRLNDS
jgi:2-polyprenyl-6-hydroxyphenyl methylase/3-demethylubiquinone-9 3-methyltransferase